MTKQQTTQRLSHPSTRPLVLSEAEGSGLKGLWMTQLAFLYTLNRYLTFTRKHD